jgi:hypothetical protein
MDIVLVFMLLLAVTGTGMCFNAQLFVQAYDDIKLHPGLKLVTSMLTLFWGSLIIGFHPVWVWGWPVLFTIFGYSLFVLATVRFLFMHWWIKVVSPLIGERQIKILGVLCLLFALFLGANIFMII